MRIRSSLALTAVLLAAAAGNFSQSRTDAASNGFLPVSEVREGMKGTAKTVFRGSRAEEFGVEILGVLPGAVGPKQDLIIGKLSGPLAERTFVFAGMSGSPVYVDGKLIGAISYSFPFSKEPICGITPIEQMISIFETRNEPKAAASEPRIFSFSELASTTLDIDPKPVAYEAGSRADDRVAAVAGQAFVPIATPMTFSGLDRRTLDLFAPQLIEAGLMPVSSAGGSAPITPLKAADESTLLGGDSVSMQLARGDISLAASGTVTLRDGQKIYAFGHSFLALGSSDLPMSESSVITVIPNLNNSFKLTVPGSMVGAMTQDRATGVFGTLGRAPKMIPVRIELTTSRGGKQSLNFEVANDDFLTPLLLNIGVFNTLSANERNVGDSTVEISGEIAIAGNEPVRISRRLTGGQSAQFAAGSVAVPVSALLRSRFDGLDISGITIKMRSTEGNSNAVLERLAISRSTVKAGETVELQAFARTPGGKIFVERIPFTIPSDTSPGTLSITVGDGAELQRSAVVQQFVPRSAADLIRTINRLKLADRLYIQAVRNSAGAVIGSSEMPNLPPSILATLNNDRTAGSFKPYVQTLVAEREVRPSELIISGQQSLSVLVVK